MRDMRADKSADHARTTDDKPHLHLDLPLAEVADSAGNHCENHRRDGHRQGLMHRHAIARHQERDRHAGTARAAKAEQKPHSKHSSENHSEQTFPFKNNYDIIANERQ